MCQGLGRKVVKKGVYHQKEKNPKKDAIYRKQVMNDAHLVVCRKRLKIQTQQKNEDNGKVDQIKTKNDIVGTYRKKQNTLSTANQCKLVKNVTTQSKC